MTNATLAKLLLTGVVVVGGGGFLVYSSVGEAQHYMQVDQLAATKLDDWKDSELKVHGHVLPGSIVHAIVGSHSEHMFVLENNGKKIRVFFRGVPPDVFEDNSEVVALGHLAPSKDLQAEADAICQKPLKPTAACPIQADAEMTWLVDASELSAKCPSRYEGGPNNKLDPKFK
jgi:cytochrome c-type biogenesis protein CcmE